MRTHDPVATSRQISDVRWVERRRRRGRTHGYLVKFIDGSGIFLCWSLSNADELAIALKKGSETSVNDAC
jgi:hypothetical protein